jgi:hypothetical protein
VADFSSRSTCWPRCDLRSLVLGVSGAYRGLLLSSTFATAHSRSFLPALAETARSEFVSSRTSTSRCRKTSRPIPMSSRVEVVIEHIARSTLARIVLNDAMAALHK